jgi:hypothetical protein
MPGEHMRQTGKRWQNKLERALRPVLAGASRRAIKKLVKSRDSRLEVAADDLVL